MRAIIVLGVAALVGLGAVAFATPASATSDTGSNDTKPVCQPGQHGNPEPAFKPTPCDPNPPGQG
jgi:hypothetical protein